MIVLWYILSVLVIIVVVAVLVLLTTFILACIGAGIASKYEHPEDE